MLKYLGIDSAAYLHKEQALEIQKHMERCDACDAKSRCDQVLEEAAVYVRPGGRLVYSVCTITAEESIDHPIPAGFEIDTTPPDVGQWRPFGHGWRVLPHDADTDGMVLIRYRRVA